MRERGRACKKKENYPDETSRENPKVHICQMYHSLQQNMHLFNFSTFGSKPHARWNTCSGKVNGTFDNCLVNLSLVFAIIFSRTRSPTFDQKHMLEQPSNTTAKLAPASIVL